MNSSLDKLVKNLTKSGIDKLKETKKVFKNKIELISRKVVYPYDHMSYNEKFEETQLPPKEEFYSKLNDCNISDEDYEHAKKVWNEFEMKNMGDYHDLYLKSDVLLLADVFEEFRNICLENYELDPAWYYTAPGLAEDAAYKESGIELELLTDIDMLLMFEKGIRGGISMISNRFGQANNKYMGEKFDSGKPSKYLPYLDANSLYAWAMSEYLPAGDFKWMSEANVSGANVTELENWRNVSCIIEVDLEYPVELHDLHNDYPLAPEIIIRNKVERKTGAQS